MKVVFGSTDTADLSVIQSVRVSDTFIEAIEVAGIERVHALGLGTGMHRVIERKNTGDPPGKDRSSDTAGFYSIYVAYPAEEKAAHLNTNL